MRKIISLGLFALILSIFSSQVIAGNVDDCEAQKDRDVTKGLYGLCIAYHNAGNDNSRNRIRASYERKAVPGDPPLDLPLDPPLYPAVSCPCWPDGELDFAVAPSACELSSIHVVIQYNFDSVQYAIFGEETDFGESCMYINNATDPTGFSFESTTAEENKACFDNLAELVVRDFPDC